MSSMDGQCWLVDYLGNDSAIIFGYIRLQFLKDNDHRSHPRERARLLPTPQKSRTEAERRPNSCAASRVAARQRSPSGAGLIHGARLLDLADLSAYARGSTRRAPMRWNYERAHGRPAERIARATPTRGPRKPRAPAASRQFGNLPFGSGEFHSYWGSLSEFALLIEHYQFKARF